MYIFVKILMKFWYNLLDYLIAYLSNISFDRGEEEALTPALKTSSQDVKQVTIAFKSNFPVIQLISTHNALVI